MRYSQLEFPAYRFVPGQEPHPTRDPAGHSYQAAAPYQESLDAACWAQCQSYLFGVDLFNHGYWWEAHEAWEGPWKLTGRHTTTGLFLQGLIQISVARLKWFQSLTKPARRLSASGLAKLELVPSEFAGLDCQSFRLATTRFFARSSRSEAGETALVIVLN